MSARRIYGDGENNIVDFSISRSSGVPGSRSLFFGILRLGQVYWGICGGALPKASSHILGTGYIIANRTSTTTHHPPPFL